LQHNPVLYVYLTEEPAVAESSAFERFGGFSYLACGKQPNTLKALKV